MHRLITLLIGCIAAAPSESVAETLALERVNIVTLEAPAILEDQTLLVGDGTILALGPSESIKVPRDATRLGVEQAFVMAGLTEMHAHVPGVLDRQYLEDVLFLYVANGITTARGMLGQGPHLALRERIAEGELLGPRLITSGPSLNGRSVANPEAAARIVKEQHAAGFDFIKLHPGLSRAEFDAAMASGREVGIPLAGHVSADVGLRHALTSGQATVDHLDGFMEFLASETGTSNPGFFGSSLVARADSGRLAEAVALFVDSGAYVVPTQTLLEHGFGRDDTDTMLRRPEFRYMPAATVGRWADTIRQLRASPDFERGGEFLSLRRDFIRALALEGRVLLGSDAPQFFNVPGFSLHRELEAMVRAGMTPAQSLFAGTAAPADFFRRGNEFGRVRVGLAADLVVTTEDPTRALDTLRNPVGVMVAGRWLSADEIAAGLAAIAARQSGR